jgi:predicted nuclease of predicted toxin-antitoxin system
MTNTESSAKESLLLDEMFPGRLASSLRLLGHDVIAITESPELRALNDPDVYAWAAANGRRILTENVRDFRPLLLHALESGGPCATLLLSSSRNFPRSRTNPNPLQSAVDNWLSQDVSAHSVEEWLQR